MVVTVTETQTLQRAVRSFVLAHETRVKTRLTEIGLGRGLNPYGSGQGLVVSY
jgi:hypothetical protein